MPKNEGESFRGASSRTKIIDFEEEEEEKYRAVQVSLLHYAFGIRSLETCSNAS